jgi:hypothetical protein
VLGIFQPPRFNFEKVQYIYFTDHLWEENVRGEFKFKRDYVNKIKMVTFWEKKWEHVL